MVFVGAVYYGWHTPAQVPGSLGLKFLAVVCMLGIFASLFGCSKKPEYPFDVEKAYFYSRSGVIAGGDFRLELSPEGVVKYYSYTKPVSENESGMRDRGADVYFVGLKEGRVEVKAIYEYPTCPPEENTFILNVAENLTVTKMD